MLYKFALLTVPFLDLHGRCIVWFVVAIHLSICFQVSLQMPALGREEENWCHAVALFDACGVRDVSFMSHSSWLSLKSS